MYLQFIMFWLLLSNFAENAGFIDFILDVEQIVCPMFAKYFKFHDELLAFLVLNIFFQIRVNRQEF